MVYVTNKYRPRLQYIRSYSFMNGWSYNNNKSHMLMDKRHHFLRFSGLVLRVSTQIRISNLHDAFAALDTSIPLRVYQFPRVRETDRRGDCG